MNRREFLFSASATALTVQRIFGSEPRYKIGYTTNTRGVDPATTWAGDPFRGFKEAREVGFHYVELSPLRSRSSTPTTSQVCASESTR